MNPIVEAIGRPERRIDIAEPLYRLKRERILVTGAAGAIGRRLVPVLRDASIAVVPTDIDTSQPWGCTYMDITDFRSILEVVAFHEPTLIIHLAAAKDAPAGEDNPWGVARTNVMGTQNIINTGKRVVFTSTCKAIMPETAYGASKLLNERMVLNAGGSVARLVNVPECGPNVVDTWAKIPAPEPLPVTDCMRYMITAREAIALILWTAVMHPGRYKIDAGAPVFIPTFALALHPGRQIVPMKYRRGDRVREPREGENERCYKTHVPWVERIESSHD